MKILTASQMKKVDQYAIRELGIPGVTLMENAGLGVVEVAIGLFKNGVKGRRVQVVCGKGNNGGDGFVVARHLKNLGAVVNVLLLAKGSDLKGDALINYRIYKRYGGKIFEILQSGDFSKDNIKNDKTDLIIDAIFGTGLSKKVAGKYRTAIEYINKSYAKVVSVDIPSGLNADSGFPLGVSVVADTTVTFGYAKLGLIIGNAAEYVGDLIIKDISLPKNVKIDNCVELIEPKYVKSLFGPRKKTSHKGINGHVLIVAGSKEKSGAAKLAAVSALRGGAGLVTLAVPESAHDIIKSSLYNVMSLPFGDDGRGSITKTGLKKVLSFAKGMDVVAIGPGLVKCSNLGDLIINLIAKSNVPLVVDADGINAVVPNLKKIVCKRENVVFTPHPGEMSRLTDLKNKDIQARRIETAVKFTKKYGISVVLKGYRSIISLSNSKTFINPTGNPAMATAGMGDVLTGLMAAYIAQQKDFEKGVLSAVFNHGLLGDLVASEMGERGVLATDLVNKLTNINRTLYPAKKFNLIEEL